jgi:peptidoglycan glycosyltransferase
VNRVIRRLAIGLLACYALLFVQLNVWQVGKRAELRANPLNNRESVRQFDAPRGPIVTSDGVVIAQTVEIPKDQRDAGSYAYQREYPTKELFANVSGYYTYAYGATQVEHLYSDVLAGNTPKQQLLAVGSTFNSVDQTGEVQLTLNSDLQKLAQRQLGNREGSAVVLDTRTGAVLAMYSNPTYDPNTVAVHNNDEAGAALEALADAPGKPLLANAYQERYMPGSTFKIITTATGLEAGFISTASEWPDENSWTPPNTKNPIQNYGKKTCGGDMFEVFRRSCNIPFARMSADMGPEVMVNGVKKWGVGEQLPIDLPNAATSTFGGEVADFTDSLALLAIHGFGQGSVQMVPLHMAMVAATVANGGAMMKPYVVAKTLAHNGTELTSTSPEVWRRPISPATAATLNTFMVGVAKEGTAKCCLALAGGVQAAAKTGTAQLNAPGETQRSHAWITTFAPAEAPRVAVAVMLKGVNAQISAGTGGTLAGPVAKVLLDQALKVVPQ